MRIVFRIVIQSFSRESKGCFLRESHIIERFIKRKIDILRDSERIIDKVHDQLIRCLFLL